MNIDDMKKLIIAQKSNIQNGNFKYILKEIEAKFDSDDPDILAILINIAQKAMDSNRSDVAYRIYSNVYNKLSSDKMLGGNHKDVIQLKYNIGMVTNSISESYKCLSESYDLALSNKYNDLSEEIKKKWLVPNI